VSGDLTFHAFWEDDPGSGWRALFERHWPHYRAWFLKDGERARASYAESLRMLREHMPELVPVYERLCELAGGGDLEARLLSMWRPPSYLQGCSQAVWTRGEPMLVRNYDYAPDRIEGAILGTGWEGRRVIGVSDFLWGLLDGINDAGLAVSLAFGGRRVVGRGFGVPLVLRYVLQTCETVAGARATLERLPYHLAHTLTLLDRGGDFVTAYVSPDRGVVFRDVPVATNHQDGVEWHEHAEATRSLEREQIIAAALEHSPDPQGLADAFLQPSVYSLDYAHGMGTLYTAIYKPRHPSVEYRWPGLRWEHSFDHFREGIRTVHLLQPSAA
jgi:predicted choloylglycine hydrolase